MKRLLALFLGLGALAACAYDREPLAVTPEFARGAPAAGARGVTVMTRNVYLGADLDPIIAAGTEEEFFVAVATAWATLQLTNFPARAEALADEIEATRPHLVGLQEVALYRTGPLFNPAPANTVAFDFLELLLVELDDRGLDYDAVEIQQSTDIEVPNPVNGIDVRFTDRDVILARGDVPTSNPLGANYAARIPLTVLGQDAGFLLRGWTSVQTQIAGNTFRFVNTHLEVQAAALVQVPQAAELLAILSSETAPIILVGDFNSAADGSQTPTYGNIAAAGYLDPWAERRPRDPGFTCCQSADLANATSNLNQRLDIVWTRGLGGGAAGVVGGLHVDLVGEEQADRTASGLWPSDHAGVVVTLTVPPGEAVANR